MNIGHRQEDAGGYFFYEENGREVAEMVYKMSDPHTMIIEHTEVDASLEGKGVGKALLAELVDYVRKTHLKVIPHCSFAQLMLRRTKEWQDVLADQHKPL